MKSYDAAMQLQPILIYEIDYGREYTADDISLAIREFLRTLDNNDDDNHYVIDNLTPFERCDYYTIQHLTLINEVLTGWLDNHEETP